MMMQTTNWIPLWPEQASTFASHVDWLYVYLIAVSVAFSIPIVVAIIVFGIRYREREKYATPEEMHGSMVLETVWSIIPFVVSMTIFLGGAIIFFEQFTPPEDSQEIYIVGKQWMWKAQHQTGQREINELHVPVGRNIKLTMTTEDVIHSFFVPAFRTKADLVPGRYTYMWFNATKPGKYHLYCAEYCGLNHSGMGGWIHVMEQRDFDNWLSGSVSGQTPVEEGKDLFTNKLGCVSCHAGGPAQRGAKLENIFNHDVRLVGGQVVKADENYIRNSILNPSAQVVEGFQPIMPTFKGQVTEEQLNSLVAYIKSLTPNAGASSSAPSGEAPAANANSVSATSGEPKTAANSNTSHK